MQRRRFLVTIPGAVMATALASRTYGVDVPTIVPASSLTKPPPALKQALAGPRRPTDDLKRDDFRKPGETMVF